MNSAVYLHSDLVSMFYFLLSPGLFCRKMDIQTDGESYVGPTDVNKTEADG